MPFTGLSATYYVATGGSNSNPGTFSEPWLTINYAESQMDAGDTIRVQAGTYNERVAITGTTGTSDNWINFVADGQVICRGFDITDVSYIRVIGFEITHTNTTYLRGISMFNTCSDIELIDNLIHDVNRGGIQATATSTTTRITIRGNTLRYMCHPNESLGAFDSSSFAVAIANAFNTSSDWLVEYNSVSRSGDFLNCYGTNILVRNNYLHDYSDSYWTNAANSFHSDMFQPGSDGVAVGTQNHLYERNFCGDSPHINSHFGIWQDTVSAGDNNILIRGNVGFNFGSTAVGVVSTDDVHVYNNSFYKMCQAVVGTTLIWYKQGSSSDYPDGALGANTIIFDDGLGTDAISIQSGSSGGILTHNIGYLAGTESSYVSTSDPLFIDPENRDFRLQSGSPAIDAGTNLVSITSLDGSGTSFDVNDGQLLIDGWGMVDGDTVTINGTTTRVTTISENTVMVADSVTWTQDDPVYWGTDTAPDIGAFPYGSAELTAASIIRAEDTYTVHVTGDARGVWFYVDGIPTTWDSTAPYAATIASGTVTAKAYALYAQESPVVSATFTTLSGGKASGSVIATGGAIVR